MLADLDELEAMVAATLAFGRDDADAEAPAALDLAELLRTMLDEAADARPDAAEHTCVCRAGPPGGARAPGGAQAGAVQPGAERRELRRRARGSLDPPRAGVVTVLVEDDGPGIPPSELERVFEPFYRLEASRNRETGGTGLGLPIARNILRAHGGDVVLSTARWAGCGRGDAAGLDAAATRVGQRSQRDRGTRRNAGS